MAKLFFGAILLISAILLATATITGVASDPAIVNYLLAVLMLLASLLQGYGLAIVALKANRRARKTNARDWNIFRHAECTSSGDVIWIAGAGWILFEEGSARLEALPSQFALASEPRIVDDVMSSQVVDASIVRPFKGSYPSISVSLENGRTIQISLAPNSGSTAWGVGRGRTIEVLQRLVGGLH